MWSESPSENELSWLSVARYVNKIMNNNAKLWIAALESGKYKQTKYRLARKAESGEITYCCLGVACEVAIENGVNIEKRERRNNILFNEWDDILPLEVRDWLGLNNVTGGFSGGGYKSLATKNDTGATFPEIAAIIKSEPEGLFKNENI